MGNVSVNAQATGKGFGRIEQKTWTITGCGTVTGLVVNSQVVANCLHVMGKFICGTPTAVPLKINLPAGTVIDSSLMPAAGFLAGYMFKAGGTGAWANTSDGPFPIYYDGSDTASLYSATAASSDDIVNKVNGSGVFGAGNTAYFHLMIPILGS